MSINITKTVAKSANTQSRDAQGRFTSSEATNLNSIPKELKQLKSLYMEEIESTTPYIYNFIKDNGVVRTLVKDGDINACLYLNKGTESFYLFFTSHSSFGFHLSCGVLAEVLNNEDTVKLSTEYEILYWDSIQKV